MTTDRVHNGGNATYNSIHMELNDRNIINVNQVGFDRKTVFSSEPGLSLLNEITDLFDRGNHNCTICSDFCPHPPYSIRTCWWYISIKKLAL